MTDITIPPEAVEAAAMADYEMTRDEALADHGIMASVTYCPWEEVSADGQEYYKQHARASIAAALNAWPGMTYAKWRDYGQADRVVLPVQPPSLQHMQTIDGRNT